MRRPSAQRLRLSGLVPLLAAALLAAPTFATTLGVMGDSLSDEYEEESYGAYAENWVEQLVEYAGIDAGLTAAGAGQPGGSWGEPRRTGYRYNWARAGADTDTLLSGGQHTGLAGQVAPEGIAYAVLAVGANDFYPGEAPYDGIYGGVWSSADINAYLNGRLENLEAALDTVLPTGVRLVLVNVPDYGVTPTVRFIRPIAAGRQRVSDVIRQLNAGIDAIAQARLLPVVDMFGATLAIFGPHASPNAFLILGNVAIELDAVDTAGGGNPTAAFVHDGIHPNTTLQGIIANTLLEALNVGYNASLPLFSEEEILAHRGLAYGGTDTLAAQLGDYGDYVTSYVADCNDGVDNDGDGRIDFDPATFAAPGDQYTVPSGEGDPGCRDPSSATESPECQDGRHNDGDGRMDYDAGYSAKGLQDPAGPDRQCVGKPWRNLEAQPLSCGLGVELALALAPLPWLRRRWRSGRV